MTIQHSYNLWSTTYDSDRNLTRDLSARVLHKKYSTSRFNSILEIGCGTGRNTLFLAGIADRVHGLDFSEGMLELARKNVRSQNVTLASANLTAKWPVESGSTDLVVCNLVLEHIENLAHIFSEASRVLKENGMFFICELHPFRQYLGGKATIRRDNETTEIDAFIHDISDFLKAAKNNKFTVESLNEHWHEEDEGKSPRVIEFQFRA